MAARKLHGRAAGLDGVAMNRSDGHLPALRGLCRRLGRAALDLFALCLIVMMAAIVVQVVASRLGIANLVSFDRPLPLFGDAITLNSLTDLQWHLMALVAIGPAALVWVADRHVRVDFLHSRCSRREKAWIEILGHVFFTLPFLVMCISASWTMMLQAYERGEKSANAGLWDRFLVKGVVPISLSLVLIVVIVESWPLLRRILGTDRT